MRFVLIAAGLAAIAIAFLDVPKDPVEPARGERKSSLQSMPPTVTTKLEKAPRKLEAPRPTWRLPPSPPPPDPTPKPLAGPLSFASQVSVRTGDSTDWSALSPDGNWFAYYDYDGRTRRLVANEIGGPRVIAFPLGYGSYFDQWSQAWDSRSRWIWTTDGESRKGGFLVGDLMPAQARVSPAPPIVNDVKDETERPVRRLPALKTPTGSVSSLLWVGNAGRAVAWLGDEASGLKPVALAMVDVPAGRMIQRMSPRRLVRRLPDVAQGDERFDLRHTIATQSPDGRMHVFAVLTALGRAGPRSQALGWMIWTEGQAPRILPRTADIDATGYALSPRGDRLLATTSVGPRQICPRAPPCRPIGPPEEGVQARAFDLSDGRELWSLPVRSFNAKGHARPVISPDGRLALIKLPLLKDGYEIRVGVIDMATGKVLQTLLFQGEDATFGFFRRDRCLVVRFDGGLATYALPGASRDDCRLAGSDASG